MQTVVGVKEDFELNVEVEGGASARCEDCGK